MEDTKASTMVDTKTTPDSINEPASEGNTIYIDPAKEKAALRKFDKYLLPVALVFLVMSSLDRSNVNIVS